MTRDEFKILVKSMKAIYVNDKFIPDSTAFELWFTLLGDLDYKQCSNAILRWMQTNKWIPTVADIREMALQNSSVKPIDSGEAWEKAREAVRKYGYMRRAEALNSVDDLTAKAIERFGWKDLCDMDPDEVMAHKAQFMRIYQQIADSKRDEAKLSQGLMNNIQLLKEREEQLKLEG